MPRGILSCFSGMEIIKTTDTGRSLKLELSDGEILFLPYGKIPGHLIARGTTVDETLYRQLKDESERYLCKDKALSYVAMKSCSARQLIQYLKKKKFSENIVQETVQRLMELRYLDDHEFSLNYIRARKGRKAVGRSRLVSELAGKGVSRKIIDRAIRETGADKDDLEEVLDLARKKYERLKDKPNGLAKTGFFLQGRGFDHGTIRRVLRMLEKDASFDQSPPHDPQGQGEPEQSE